MWFLAWSMLNFIQRILPVQEDPTTLQNVSLAVPPEIHLHVTKMRTLVDTNLCLFVTRWKTEVILRSWEMASCIASMLYILCSSHHSHSVLTQFLEGLTDIFSAIVRIYAIKAKMRCSLLYFLCFLFWFLSIRNNKMKEKCVEKMDVEWN